MSFLLALPVPTGRSPVAWPLLGLALSAAPLAAQSYCAPQKPDTGYVALTGVTLWDGTGAPARSGTTILIHGERIAGVFPDGGQALPPGTASKSLSGKFAIPGLIDAHAHVATDPSGEDSRARTERRLCRALLGGVTAVRDMAGDVRALASLQRDAKVGDIAAPDVYYAALWAGPAFFADPRTAAASAGETPGSLPWMRAIDSTTDLRQAVAEARGTGATAIKLYAALTPTDVSAIVAESHRQHLPVWAHAAMGAVTPQQMVAAGVDAVSHASLLLRALGTEGYAAQMKDSTRAMRGRFDLPVFDSLFAQMRQRGTLFEPTLFIYDGERAKLLPYAAEITRRADQLGVSILAGTDSVGSGDEGAWQLPNLHQELQLLVREAGLSNAAALGAATRNAASALAAFSDRGTVAAGKLADIVILDGDPLAEIGNTATIRLVVKRGALYPGGPTLAR
jgi:imidazolonepropionase-like amidohydrolase